PPQASFVGSSACQSCHASEYTYHQRSGHNFKLNPVSGSAPVYPAVATNAGVPNPPSTYNWTDITYVIGGYGWKSRFMDSTGYIITDGYNGVNAQYNLVNPTIAHTTPTWSAYHASDTAPKPYTCGKCHTTGWLTTAQNGGVQQGGLIGIDGTWDATGIQCEACHGNGSLHVASPSTANIIKDTSAAACGTCHFRDAQHRIEFKGSFIRHHEQYDELLASGGHSTHGCVTCHDPHKTARYQDSGHIVANCTTANCHGSGGTKVISDNWGSHVGQTYYLSDATQSSVVYSETITCKSCHMAYATKSAVASSAVGTTGLVGDVKTHIFRIDSTGTTNATNWATDDGSGKFFVNTDGQGRAAVPLDYVCLRCHNDSGRNFSDASLTQSLNAKTIASAAGDCAAGSH
ncbi:MAG: hypothetical protein ACYTHN_04625, partial [Planctomycetota bacterium]